MGKSLNYESVSGIYTCYCGNLETHINGKSKAPCSSCAKNSSWSLILETEELDRTLNSDYPGIEFNTLGGEMVSRFKNRSF